MSTHKNIQSGDLVVYRLPNEQVVLTHIAVVVESDSDAVTIMTGLDFKVECIASNRIINVYRLVA